eukprot:6919905-Pyramimonas_sp.AAC.1
MEGALFFKCVSRPSGVHVRPTSVQGRTGVGFQHMVSAPAPRTAAQTLPSSCAHEWRVVHDFCDFFNDTVGAFVKEWAQEASDPGGFPIQWGAAAMSMADAR